VSMEFDLGYLLKDTEKYLEGSGKYRRHLKIFNKRDIENQKKSLGNILSGFFFNTLAGACMTVFEP